MGLNWFTTEWNDLLKNSGLPKKMDFKGLTEERAFRIQIAKS